MQAILWPIVTWLLREIIIKFIVVSAVFFLVAIFVPFAVSYVAGFIGVGSLTSAFSALPAGIWFFLDYFQVGFGLPLVIAAAVSRFLIRRLPVIG